MAWLVSRGRVDASRFFLSLALGVAAKRHFWPAFLTKNGCRLDHANIAGPKQVGMHAMVASAEASCKVFSAATTLDPHALFEMVGFRARARGGSCLIGLLGFGLVRHPLQVAV